MWTLDDGQNTVRDTIDSSGAIEDHITYNAFGQPLSHTAPNPAAVDAVFGYDGLFTDPTTGDDFAVNRVYDPSSGTWLTPDPAQADVNTYRAFGNSPTNEVDPEGLVGENKPEDSAAENNSQPSPEDVANRISDEELNLLGETRESVLRDLNWAAKTNNSPDAQRVALTGGTLADRDPLFGPLMMDLQGAQLVINTTSVMVGAQIGPAMAPVLATGIPVAFGEATILANEAAVAAYVAGDTAIAALPPAATSVTNWAVGGGVATYLITEDGESAIIVATAIISMHPEQAAAELSQGAMKVGNTAQRLVAQCPRLNPANYSPPQGAFMGTPLFRYNAPSNVPPATGPVNTPLLQRYLNESGGRWGGTATRQLNHAEATALERQGFRVTNGAGRGPEEWFAGPGGGTTGGTFVDITATRGGQTVRVQTVTTLADGVTLTPSEAAAAARIRARFPGDQLIIVSKQTGQVIP